MSVSTVSDDTPLDPDDELLVAYLDGELDRKAQSALEDRLLDDEPLRRRLQQLQTGWDLLEDLPDPAPSLKLVESTLELVVADIVKEQSPKESMLRRYRWPLGVAATCLIAIAGSFAIAASLSSREYEQQLDDLAVAEFLDAYNYGEDLKLMRQLSADPNWAKMVTAARELGDIEIVSQSLASTSLETREKVVKELPLEQMDQLNSRWEQFTRLDESNQKRIRRTAASVTQQPDADLLRETMQAYATWRQTLEPELRDRLESNDAKVRRDAIKEATEDTQVSISRRSGLRLDEETIDWIYFSLGIVLQERIKNGATSTTEYYNEALRRQSEADAKLRTIGAMVFDGSRERFGGGGGGGGPGREGPGGGGPGTEGPSGGGPGREGPGGPGAARAPDTGRPGSGGPGNGGPGFGGRRGCPRGERPKPLQSDEIETIKLPLPEQALDILDLVAAGDPFMESATLQMWCEETVRRRLLARYQDDSTLLERYKDLAPEQRSRLDLLEPEEFLKELARPSRFSRWP
ncbi:MAG: anti-sigma factor family protein [Rubripirellula sp.]